jgi:hypothetical protein
LKKFTKFDEPQDYNTKNFLDKETKESQLKLHEPDANNEIMSKDILKEYDAIKVNNYEMPLDVTKKFGDLPTLTALSK